MKDNILVGFLTPILGKYRITARNNIAFQCPFGEPHEKCQVPNKFKLEVNVITNSTGENPWHCWVCGAKGKTIRSLLEKLDVPQDDVNYIQSYIKKDNGGNPSKQRDSNTLRLPKEFIPLHKKQVDREFYLAKKYCISRGLTKHDIMKYNIGYCPTGKYSRSIIFPSYDKDGKLNYFLSRSYIPNSRSFNAPVCDKESVIGFELFINWNVPVTLCEGPFDAAAIKRNVVPLFGKTIPKALMKRLVMSDVRTVYLALDNDALKNTYRFAEEFINMGKEVYVVELPEKDPSELGFKNYTSLVQKARPLTFSKLFLNKLNKK